MMLACDDSVHEFVLNTCEYASLIGTISDHIVTLPPVIVCCECTDFYTLTPLTFLFWLPLHFFCSFFLCSLEQSPGRPCFPTFSLCGTRQGLEGRREEGK